MLTKKICKTDFKCFDFRDRMVDLFRNYVTTSVLDVL